MQGSKVLSGTRLHSRPKLCSTSSLQPKVQTAVSRQPQAFQVEARVVIRFQRYGRRKAPFFRIVAIDTKTRREGVPIERLGWYNPLSKETSLNAPAIKKWIGVGAKPTEATAKLLKKAMVIEADTPVAS